MAHGPADSPPALDPLDTEPVGDRATPGALAMIGIGAGLLLVALLLMVVFGKGYAFGFSYITAFAFVLSLGLGCLFFVLITHLFRAGWCVVLRRPVEHIAASFPVLAVLALPIMLLVVAGDGWFYPWAQPMEQLKERYQLYHYGYVKDDASYNTEQDSYGTPDHQADPDHDAQSAIDADQPLILLAANEADPDHAHDDHGHAAHGEHPWAPPYDLVEKKLAYLNTGFFMIRWVAYFAVWIVLGLLYWRWSIRQDHTGEVDLTHKREWWAPIAIILFATTSTFAAFDLLMSLDPAWFSTMWGVYYFAGSMLATFALIILICVALKSFGRLKPVGVEHFHDLGKLLFAFVFFWGYIAFSQYMLIWYANIPEETMWMEHHGFTTVPDKVNGWSYVGLFILAGHFVVPFLFLLSRWVKRAVPLLMVAAGWLIFMHYVDVWWIVMPHMDGATPLGDPVTVAMQVCLAVGMLAILLGVALLRARRHAWIPTKDPRLGESVRFENF
ncbi:MAG: hypothetical protein AAF823_13415 [Planctomycetota bacterium]